MGNTRLKQFPIKLPSTERPMGMVTVRNRTPSSVAELFRDCIRDMAKPLVRDRRIMT
jgi:hypothetical protein